MATKKKTATDDASGVPVRTETRATRYPDGVPVQVPQTTTTETSTTDTKSTKKGS